MKITSQKLRKIIKEEAGRAELISTLSAAFAATLKSRVLNMVNRMTFETAEALGDGPFERSRFEDIVARAP